MYIDLHTHSTCSDGTYTPQQIAEETGGKGINPFSITDHDNIMAYDEPLNCANDQVFIPGVEISAEFSKGTLHILGYGIDTTNQELKHTLDELQQFRLNRNKKMLEKMKTLGFDISMEELFIEAKGEIIGRPHFANLMYAKGYVSSYQEAFDKYLTKGAPLYMDKKRLSPHDSIDLITQAGGIPVIAHPYQTKREDEELANLVEQLREMGLMGIEAFYSLHSQEMIEEYLGYADRYGLLVTAGSDFHGGNKPTIGLGINAPDKWIKPFLETIMERGNLSDKHRQKLKELIFRSVR